ncbi:hypothetical protein FHR83_006332 [Actinoplanes campanulatus]|uniref:Uncharacterized protein n=1 Tax=Actinoplanes campanulatus TaxID=113559 RepID=A0A7W5FHG4_9ACTN|nr:hypothetical protein [Actinoplanes campanulatus]
MIIIAGELGPEPPPITAADVRRYRISGVEEP